jgi:DNA-directed RNA polymerase
MALAEGERLFRLQVAKDIERGEFSRSAVAKQLLQRGIEPLENAIALWLPAAKKVRAAKHTAIKWLDAIGAPVAAYMTLKAVFDGITKRRDYISVCEGVSDLIADELRYRVLQEKAPRLFEYKLKHFRTSSYAHMARSLDHAVRTARDEEGELIDAAGFTMTHAERATVGAKLIELLVASTGLIKVETKHTTNGKGLRRTQLYIEATPETTEWLTKRTDVLVPFQAQNLPMVIPPLQWAPGKRGGYRFALYRKYPLVRGIMQRTVRQEIEGRDMPVVFEALNVLQNTPWRINRAVYDLVREIERRGGGIAGIPVTDLLPLPNRPYDIATNTEARAKWRKAAGQVKDQNHLRKMRGRSLQRTLDCAAGVLDEGAIFFPYSLDFRGRIYPIADYLHPQGDDLSKGLLTFAQGKPIEEVGARWLAIHGANCLGETPQGKVSKMTLDERVQWIHQHTRQIVEAAESPFADTWWAQADDPMQFFAFCVEWRNLIRANDKGEEYVSTLPCAMDGTCNGLQHFSAMLRDEVGGKAVNVLPQDRPQDIYERVADSVLDMLQELPDDPLAVKLLGSKLVTRKLAKRPTMTFGYGSKRYGFKQQLKEYLQGLENWHEVKTLFTTTDPKTGQDKLQVNAACSLLAQCIWDSLASVVVKAAQGMKWMQECARGVVVTGKPVEWIVPVTGFKVRQDYCQWKKRRLQTVLAGKIVRSKINDAPQGLDKVKQSNAVAPNIVHSLDAAALMLTVTQASAEGVEAFAMVHDSYGALAADCGVLARCCRQSFVRLYTSEDITASLFDQFQAQFVDKEKCPPPPIKGSLDVNGVLASDYFFS